MEPEQPAQGTLPIFALTALMDEDSMQEWQDGLLVWSREKEFSLSLPSLRDPDVQPMLKQLCDARAFEHSNRIFVPIRNDVDETRVLELMASSGMSVYSIIDEDSSGWQLTALAMSQLTSAACVRSREPVFQIPLGKALQDRTGWEMIQMLRMDGWRLQSLPNSKSRARNPLPAFEPGAAKIFYSGTNTVSNIENICCACYGAATCSRTRRL